jgi:hypothetical protein
MATLTDNPSGRHLEWECWFHRKHHRPLVDLGVGIDKERRDNYRDMWHRNYNHR